MFSHATWTMLSCTVASLFLSGCVATIKEDHYWQALDANGEPTNYFRLSVRGQATMSSARYVSGYYDERAVDLFFNELKVNPTQPSDTDTLFEADLLDNTGENEIKPLLPGEQDGAYMLILSTNASSVTNTVGQFAENQVVADAVTNLVNRDLIRTSRTQILLNANSANASAEEVRQLMAAIPTDGGDHAADLTTAYLRVLNGIALSIDKQAESFDDLDAAQRWFDLQRVRNGL